MTMAQIAVSHLQPGRWYDIKKYLKIMIVKITVTMMLWCCDLVIDDASLQFYFLNRIIEK
jgi:hypothetical protein